MKPFASSALALALSFVTLGSADAGFFQFGLRSDQAASTEVAQSECYSIGQSVARERGGRLVDVRDRGSQCVLIIVLPSSDGPRRRIELTVPKR